MQRTLDTEGGEAAVNLYRELREKSALSGSFDFREWEVNTLGRAPGERRQNERRDYDL